MRILVISDSHGDITNAEKILNTLEDIDVLIHLGDYFRDAEKLVEMRPNLRVEYIYGNSDFMIGNVAAEKIIEIAGKRFFITHGHRYSVKSGHDKLIRKAEEVNADVMLFGHTHVSTLLSENNRLYINPGSISESRDSFPESYAIIQINEDKIIPSLEYV